MLGENESVVIGHHRYSRIPGPMLTKSAAERAAENLRKKKGRLARISEIPGHPGKYDVLVGPLAAR